MSPQVEIVNFAFLTIILLFGVSIVGLFFWASIRYLKKTSAFATGSNVTLTKGKVIKKFYSGGDPRLSGLPTMKLSFKFENEFHEIDREVEQEIFFEYDEGEDIDLFVSNKKELKVYPLKSIQEKKLDQAS